ncbi:MAG: 50S ribosomal protein L29 [Ignavibacteriaceae bacterium]|nr:50S ribosomal protein L29 [Ignavibacteriaceae bacterium]
MKINEIRELTTQELEERLTKEYVNLIDDRFAHALKTLENTSKLKNSRKTIARLNTVLTQRKLQETGNK